MKKEFENDELLNKLSKSAKKTKAPILPEEILHSATRSESKFGPRRLHTPRLVVNLVGGAAVLAGVFALSLNPPQSAISDRPCPELDCSSWGSALIAMGNVSFTEEQLVVNQKKKLADWGQKAVGNYVSNHPESYVDRAWSGEKAHWIFVVVDGVYFPNDGTDELRDLLQIEKLNQFSEGLSADSNSRGIKLLIQDQSSGGALYPLVIKEDPNSSFYQQVRDVLLSKTYTIVPLN